MSTDSNSAESFEDFKSDELNEAYDSKSKRWIIIVPDGDVRHDVVCHLSGCRIHRTIHH